MRGALKKKHDHYTLWTDDGSCIANTINPDGFPYKLSRKNYLSIERGYDLDELAYDCSVEWYGEKMDSAIEIYKESFQKALELMGDKKFTEEDIKKMMKSASYGWFTSDFDKHIATLQQTEWDIEIVMEEVSIGDKYTPEPKPKLGQDGCLILKRSK